MCGLTVPAVIQRVLYFDRRHCVSLSTLELKARQLSFYMYRSVRGEAERNWTRSPPRSKRTTFKCCPVLANWLNVYSEQVNQLLQFHALVGHVSYFVFAWTSESRRKLTCWGLIVTHRISCEFSYRPYDSFLLCVEFGNLN